MIEHLAAQLRAAYLETGDKRFARALAELSPEQCNELALARMAVLMRENPALPARSAAALVAEPCLVSRLASIYERAQRCANEPAG